MPAIIITELVVSATNIVLINGFHHQTVERANLTKIIILRERYTDNIFFGVDEYCGSKVPAPNLHKNNHLPVPSLEILGRWWNLLMRRYFELDMCLSPGLHYAPLLTNRFMDGYYLHLKVTLFVVKGQTSLLYK